MLKKQRFYKDSGQLKTWLIAICIITALYSISNHKLYAQERILIEAQKGIDIAKTSFENGQHNKAILLVQGVKKNLIQEGNLNQFNHFETYYQATNLEMSINQKINQPLKNYNLFKSQSVELNKMMRSDHIRWYFFDSRLNELLFLFKSRNTTITIITDLEIQLKKLKFFLDSLSFENNSIKTNIHDLIVTYERIYAITEDILNKKVVKSRDYESLLEDKKMIEENLVIKVFNKKEIDLLGLGYDFTGYKRWSNYTGIFQDVSLAKNEIERVKTIISHGFYNRAIEKSNLLLKEFNSYYHENNLPQTSLLFKEAIYQNLSKAHLKLKNFEDSKYFLDSAKNIYNNIDYSYKEGSRRFKYENLYIDYYLFEKEYNEAIKYALLKLNFSPYYKGEAGQIATLHYAAGNYDEAIQYHKKISEWNKNELKKYGGFSENKTLDWFIGNAFLAKGEIKDAEAYLNPIFIELTNKDKLDSEEEDLLRVCLIDLAIINSINRNWETADILMSTYLRNYSTPIFQHLLSATENDRDDILLEDYYNPDVIFNYLSNRNSNTGEVVGGGYNVALLSKMLLFEVSRKIPQIVSRSKNKVMRELNSRLLEIKHALKSVDVKEKDSLMDYARYYEWEIINTWKDPILSGLSGSLVNWKNIQDKLNYGEAAIEFITFRPYGFENNNKEVIYGAFIIGKGYEWPKFITLFSENELNLLLKPFKDTKQSDKEKIQEIYEAKGEKIYELIWEPLEKYLINIPKIYYSPAGILNSIAFSALKNKEGKAISDRHSLVRLVSTKNISDSENFAKLSGVVLFGDIAYNAANRSGFKEVSEETSRGSSFNSLPGTKKEIDELNKILKSNNIESHQYDQMFASEENLFKISNDNSIDAIHIATHAFYIPPLEEDELLFTPMIGWSIFKEEDDPMNRSGLALSGANQFWLSGNPINQNGYDGILTANEISNLNLKGIKLVVLSACETALGDSRDNEGVFGLQRGLKMAGVDNLLLSLWKVDDQVTQEFMVEFYKKLISNDYSIESAFYKTQSQIKNKYPDPYYWAAFVLIR